MTINSWKRKEIFSSIIDQNIILSEPGRIIQGCWTGLPKHFETVELGNFSIMPNHLHGIIIIHYRMNENDNLVSAKHASHLPRESGTTRGSLSAIIQSFKSSSTRLIHKNTDFSEPVWQRSFYDRIIRNEREVRKLSDYISLNPHDWDDKYLHSFLKKDAI